MNSSTRLPSLHEMRSLWQKTLQAARKSEQYAWLMEKRYRTPNNYISYDTVANHLAAHTLKLEILRSIAVDPREYFADFIAATTAAHMAYFKAPVYWIGADLLKAILNTSLPNFVAEGMKRPVQFATLMLPRNILFTPDGEEVSYVSFGHILANESLPKVNVNGTAYTWEALDYETIQFLTTTTSSTTYASNTGLVGQSVDELDTGDWLPSAYYNCAQVKLNPEQLEKKFMAELRLIVIQSILLLQSRPDLLEIGEQVGFASTPMSKKNRAKKGAHTCSLLLNPNWLGKDYRIKRATDQGEGTHASPRMHWRRGHNRRVAIGEGRTGREWRWFEPVLVNAKNG